MVVVLGIESTAHTFGVGIVKNGKILSNVKDSFTTIDGSGGMIPNKVAEHHREVKDILYEKALKEAGVTEDKIEMVAFSQGPGLAPCLLEGMRFTKELSFRLNVPVIQVNHCIAHQEIGRITGAKDPVLLYASGANTQVIAYESGKYRVFGETLDLGVGNFIDSFARYVGLGFPGGPKIQELASKGKKYIELPYKVKGMDVALSGILTNLKQKYDSKEYSLEDISFSLQECVFSMLVEVAERALAHTGKKELVLGGGVGCNSRLQEMCRIMCKERGCKFFCPDRSLLVDNGAMIAYTGEVMFKGDKKISINDYSKLDILPRQRTDDVLVSWR
jgi:N6-L-threonylcarbamoyladenine synthase